MAPTATTICDPTKVGSIGFYNVVVVTKLVENFSMFWKKMHKALWPDAIPLLDLWGSSGRRGGGLRPHGQLYIPHESVIVSVGAF